MTERELTEHVRLLRYVMDEAVQRVMEELEREKAALSGMDTRQGDVAWRSATELERKTQELHDITGMLGAEYWIEPIVEDIAIALCRLIKSVLRAEIETGNGESVAEDA